MTIAISESFLKSGAKVIATYQSNDSAAHDFQNANATFADRLVLKKFDITQYSEVENFFRLVEENHGPFQIMVNSSGIRRFTVKSDGAGYALDEEEMFWGKILVTDVPVPSDIRA